MISGFRAEGGCINVCGFEGLGIVPVDVGV